MLRIEKRRNKPLVVLSVTALAAASLCAPALALAQHDAGASRPPIELSPMRVTSVTTVVIAEPIVIEGGASSSHPDPTGTRAEPRRAADGRAIENPFGSNASDPVPTAVAQTETSAASDEDESDEPLTASNRRRPSSDRVYRCAPGQRSYFDERSSLYRPCTDNSGPPRVRVDRSPNVRAGWRAAATASCRTSGVLSYFDPVEQLYRPCPPTGQPIPVTQSNGSAREPRPVRTRERCSPGQHSYFDRRASLYRPCLTE